MAETKTTKPRSKSSSSTRGTRRTPAKTAATDSATATKAAAKPPRPRKPRATRAKAQPERHSNTARGLGIGAAVAAVAAAGLGLYRYLTRPGAEGTEPTDLEGDTHPDGSERAIDAFRPDPTAPVPASEREALRPALAGAAAPTLVAGQAGDLTRVDSAPS